MLGIFETLSMDFAGPLPLNKSGYQYIIVAIKHLTQWVLSEASPSQMADAAILFFNAKVVQQFGSPTVLWTDCWPAFTSGAWKKAARSVRTTARITAAYPPELNGKVERMIQTLKKAMSLRVMESGSEWDILFPDIVSAYRARAGSDGYFPFKLMYGVAPECFMNHALAKLRTFYTISGEGIHGTREARIAH